VNREERVLFSSKEKILFLLPGRSTRLKTAVCCRLLFVRICCTVSIERQAGDVNRNWDGLHTIEDKEVRCCAGDKGVRLMCNAGDTETWFREEVWLV
jgi:hypothetical protein